MSLKLKNFYTAPSSLVALVLIAVCTVLPVFAQTALQGQLSLRPLTRDDIASFKLPATTQVSGGLKTVGLGQPAYLEALVPSAVKASDIAAVTWELTTKPTASNAALVDSPLGKEVLIYEPSDQEAFQVVGRKMLRPDVAGQYVISATIATAGGETAKVTMNVTGATYVGIKSCTMCHGGAIGANMVSAWSNTGHASIFKEGMDGVASDHYGSGCLGCHTVGYDANPDAVNGGFDDVAKQLNWTFPTVMKAGTFDSLPDALKNVGNIQCENCHGPGSQHAASANKSFISKSYDSGACNQCHAALTHHSKTGEWMNSGHAVATREAAGAGREGCVGCHTGAGFMAKMKGAAITNTDYTAINCQTCHEPHGRTAAEAEHQIRNMSSVKLADGTEITSGGSGKLCMNCHQSRQNAATYAATAAGTARFGPHHGPQADMLQGANAFTYGLKIPSSAHGDVVENACVTCHMQSVAVEDPAFTKAGGHTFRTRTEDGIDLVAACQSCHGDSVTSFNFALMDYDGDGVIEGAQTEVQHLLDKLALQLPPVGKPKTSLAIDDTWTRAQLEAGYNWLFVQEDGSKGIHNMAYTIGLLKASIADVTGKK